MSSDSEQVSSGASSYASDSDVEIRSVQVGSTGDSKKRKSMESSENKKAGGAKAKKFKSASVVASSDIEDDVPYDPINPFVFGQGGYISHQKRLDSKHQGPSTKSRSIFSEDEDPQPKKKSIAPMKPNARSCKKQRSKPKSKPVEADVGSGDSNMENEPLVTQKKTVVKEKKIESKSKRAPTTKKTADKKSSDKNDATIKRLKSLVLACGVRKPWATLFEGVDRPSQQIKIIKDILTELGMKGRMSMEQAKAIREKRELEEELADVQSFEKSFVSRSSGSRAMTKKAVESDQDDSNEEMTGKSVKRKMSARQSIVAFLGDESD
ncbi:uncharacterized protein BT62DRAFT_920811 [Guyanagaster necrorhizus]|uniref:Uncharacterized protein n=1 Tax=Guyanagaster necrorhizus TaxID=856835 RepID=A0A9P8ARM5_9AGAR|nr:uncharacterized protein BT62DRAFT_920811 [Guyanagaster necrorhizus MCA 3950]KAG7445056.1 hypothetical protein BT62DRAFT_920811 [Guyanagaster necrorhizus MCA 3950]